MNKKKKRKFEKISENSDSFKPFEDLKKKMKNKYFELDSVDSKNEFSGFFSKKMTPDQENNLFRQAMIDVEPIKNNKKIPEKRYVPKKEPEKNSSDKETLSLLKDLVIEGKGFKVDDTPEYMEGIGYNVNPNITKRLHKGDFSVQSHIDLHGLTAEEAEYALENFFKESIANHNSSVLIIHGRGLSSKGAPVLKNKVKEWLSRGHFRKWVVAFTSARSCDGGAGATYVLLRQNPVTRKNKINKH